MTATPEIRALAQFTLDHLRLDTWVNHPPYPGQNCLITAMPWGYRRAHILCAELERRLVPPGLVGDPMGTVAAWNDNPDRTFAEVEALLLSVINDVEDQPCS